MTCFQNFVKDFPLVLPKLKGCKSVPRVNRDKWSYAEPLVTSPKEMFFFCVGGGIFHPEICGDGVGPTLRVLLIQTMNCKICKTLISFFPPTKIHSVLCLAPSFHPPKKGNPKNHGNSKLVLWRSQTPAIHIQTTL